MSSFCLRSASSRSSKAVSSKPRQAVELDFAGECRHSRIVLGSLVSVVNDSGAPGRDDSADMRLLE